MVARVVECSDYDVQYGILTVENVSIKEVQEKIYDIKNKFHNNGFDEWCLDDIFAEFPEEWVWDFISCDTRDEAIEI